LRELRDGCVALKSSQMAFDMTHERVSRLQPQYIHALTQRLAAVFSAIGLPDSYEAARADAGMRLLNSEMGDG
jgi:hypothetical protein